MSEKKSKAVLGAVLYIQQHKDKYSVDELKKKLQESGYPENVIAEAEKSALSVSVSTDGAIAENISRGKKIVDFLMGFFGYYLFNFITLFFVGWIIRVLFFGVGLISFGASIYLYFYFRKRRKYVARGILTAFILSILLVIAVFLFLFFIFGGF